MKYAEIPAPTIKETDQKDASQFKHAAPGYLRSVIEEAHALDFVSSIDELKEGEVSLLAGGNDATTYLVRLNGAAAIVKLGDHGLGAEAEALQAWQAKSVHAPRVYKQGIVPKTRGSDHKIGFLVEQAMVDVHGRLAETCQMYLKHSPDQARHVGKLLGQELAKVHSCISDRSFGDYADSGGNTAPYSSWNHYLIGYLDAQKDFLLQHDVTPDQIDAIRGFIERCKYASHGCYLHGDFSVRNAAIQPFKDTVILFDPNPVIGDPSWDLAVLYNNHEYSRRQQERDSRYKDIAQRDEQLLIGFKQGYDRQIDERNVLTAQLLQSALHTSFHESRVEKGVGNEDAFKARLDTVLDLVERICTEAAKDES